MTPAVASCANHPGRAAIGVCIRCRTRICAECSTRIEGVNHCSSCVASLWATTSRRVTSVGRGPGPQPFGVLAVATWLVALTMLGWGMLEVLLPG
ncbi:MAG: hypothetical protein NZ898_07330 [Myxococcota bacterium]|nr:hypothetical protein [Myxococcota bacterium]MDW8362140.1 hypothetical protein [Myxococcales bacterium]